MQQIAPTVHLRQGAKQTCRHRQDDCIREPRQCNGQHVSLRMARRVGSNHAPAQYLSSSPKTILQIQSIGLSVHLYKYFSIFTTKHSDPRKEKYFFKFKTEKKRTREITTNAHGCLLLFYVLATSKVISGRGCSSWKDRTGGGMQLRRQSTQL